MIDFQKERCTQNSLVGIYSRKQIDESAHPARNLNQKRTDCVNIQINKADLIISVT